MNIPGKIDELGYAFERQALEAGQREMLLDHLRSADITSGRRQRAGGTYAARNILWDIPGLAAALTSIGLDAIAAEALGPPLPDQCDVLRQDRRRQLEGAAAPGPDDAGRASGG